MTDGRRVALTGATGFTGRLTARALMERGIEPVLIGRDRGKLEALATELGHGLAVRVVDDRTPQTWADALADAHVVVATAGPFVTVGEPALAFAARNGRRYVDCTGEQSFVRLAVARYQATAEASGACLLPSCGFESAMGVWAASLAASELGGDEPIDAIDVVYATRGFGTSAGTRESALRVAAADGVARVGGVLVDERPASRWKEIDVEGRRVRAGCFPGVEALVVPRHVKVRDVRSHLAMGRRAGRVSRIAVPLLRGAPPALVELAARLAKRGGSPETAPREGARFVVVAEARRGRDCVRATITGTDPYGLTAALLAEAALALGAIADARARGLAGVVSPSEVLAPTETIARLGRFELRATVG
ncbi:MAG: NAD(P)H-binding protein [Deltaproteobacteria bacterium]|nr:NAD(P)H-binding protein [Deltaproteobacteria bacterium]